MTQVGGLPSWAVEFISTQRPVVPLQVPVASLSPRSVFLQRSSVSVNILVLLKKLGIKQPILLKEI